MKAKVREEATAHVPGDPGLLGTHGSRRSCWGRSQGHLSQRRAWPGLLPCRGRPAAGPQAGASQGRRASVGHRSLEFIGGWEARLSRPPCCPPHHRPHAPQRRTRAGPALWPAGGHEAGPTPGSCQGRASHQAHVARPWPPTPPPVDRTTRNSLEVRPQGARGPQTERAKPSW